MRLLSVWAMMVPSGMVTAMKFTSGLCVICSSRNCSRMPICERMPVRRTFSKAVIREKPLSARRRVSVVSLRSTEMSAGKLTMMVRVTKPKNSSIPMGICARCSLLKSLKKRLARLMFRGSWIRALDMGIHPSGKRGRVEWASSHKHFSLSSRFPVLVRQYHVSALYPCLTEEILPCTLPHMRHALACKKG